MKGCKVQAFSPLYARVCDALGACHPEEVADMPAKLKLTYALVEQIVELKRDGLCDADIIAAIGVHQATFYHWLKEGENAKTGVKRALYEELKNRLFGVSGG